MTPGNPGNPHEPAGDSHNTARFFVENRQISWVLLLGTVLWGVYGYIRMPKRKDPEFRVTTAAAVCPWPGVPASRIEELVTRKLEQKISENQRVNKLQSSTRGGVAVLIITLEDGVKQPEKEWDDINLKLNSIDDLPRGAGPIYFLKDFGDTAALMLTVASPKAGETEIAWRAERVREAIVQARSRFSSEQAARRTALLMPYPLSVNLDVPRHNRDMAFDFIKEKKAGRDAVPIDGPGFVGIDADLGPDDNLIRRLAGEFISERLRPSEVHPDAWQIVLVRDPAATAQSMRALAGARYSYHELDTFSDLVQRTLQTLPLVSKVTRAGVLKERIFLEYSQQRLASFGLQPGSLRQILSARNITFPGGLLEVSGKGLLIDPSGEFQTEKEIGDVILTTSPSGSPVYLRDAMDIRRAYDSPPLYLNAFTYQDSQNNWRRSPAVTLAVNMRAGQQIADFGAQVDEAMAGLKRRLPEDLVLARTSDQPLQVRENISLFMQSLYEAIVLVVLIALIGFWEWRSALLMALSIPATLALTFGMMSMVGIDLQQVSIASLIIALGLLVDDPVVAGDAIKRELAHGSSRLVAAWLGPTKLATPILFATITNIVAYLPMLLIQGNTGDFIYSLPIVLTCSLVASRLVSMTFVPLLGYYLLRAPKRREIPMEERRRSGFGGFYYKVGHFAIDHRKMVLAGSLLIFVAGGYFLRQLQRQFFPKDLSYLSFVDVWLPEDSVIGATNATATQVERIITQVAAQYGKDHPQPDGKPRQVLSSLTTFVGGGGPRFWFSVAPELLQLNYAQVIIRLEDKHDTEHLVAPLQRALSAGVPGARVDVRQLETGRAIGVPVQIRVSGDDIGILRQYAARVKSVFRSVPEADRVRDDWGSDNFTVRLTVDEDRANLSGVSNLDVAMSSAVGISGLPVTTLREGDREIPVTTRLRTEERSRLGDIENLYVYSTTGPQRVPLEQVSSLTYDMETQKIQRRNQFYTMTVGCFPVPGALPSLVMKKARPALLELAAAVPPGFKLEIGGEEEEQVKGFRQIVVVLVVSAVLIFLALVVQFRNAVKPLIVFAAIPYGVVGAVAAISLMGSPFGFMGFLGVASLIGVIVSHVIVLFDFIEEAHHAGEPLREALLDAGILRLRPVLITVAATVIALFPLALHGGPLWEPMCYAQIGGLLLATVITLMLVPVLYAVFVLDMKIVTWQEQASLVKAGGGE